jgi:bifunctional non-homologous end joining protein LigD
VEAIRPPAGPQWVHEIKHDGYQLIVRRVGDRVRLWTRWAVDFTDRFPAIAGAAALTTNSSRSDGEAVVIGPDGLGAVRRAARRESARAAILYAFDLIEHNGEDPFCVPRR